MLENLNNKDKGTLICGAIFLVVIIFVISNGFFKTPSKSEKQIDRDTINILVNQIKDNYRVVINKNLNNQNEEIIYYTDNKLQLYENSNLSDGVILYNDKLFCLNSDTMNLSECSSEYDYVKESFYNYEFIKILLNKCDYKFISKDSVTCNISLKDFFLEYNKINDIQYNTEREEDVVFNITYNSSYISKLNIDFSNAYNVINGENNKFILNYTFTIGGNDYDKIYEHYKDILEG